MIAADTHTVHWLMTSPEMISATALDALDVANATGGGIAIADKTMWELANLIARRRIAVPIPMGSFLRLVEKKFVVLPLTAEVAEISVSFSEKYPKDPADRIIGATALAHGLALVTKDQAIRASGEVNCIW